jgi:uncharacterized protein (DUF885 family)
MTTKPFLRAFLFALALVLAGAAPSGRAASPAWDAFVDDYLEAYFRAQPTAAVWAGRHEFDGRLPDWSRAGIEREIGRLKAARGRALAFRDDALSADQRFERDYLVTMIDTDLFWADTARWPFRSPTFYDLEPNVYVFREYAPLADRMRAYTRYARAVPAAARQIRENLRPPLPRTYVQMGHIMFGGLAGFYEHDAPVAFAAVGDPQLKAEFDAANAGAIAAMKELDAWVTAQEAQATDRYALGATMFATMLKATERIDVPLARLKRIAEGDLERNVAALRQACAAYAPAATLAACVAKLRADRNPAAFLETARGQLAMLRSFIEKKALLTIPGSEGAKVELSPPYARWNAASIMIPGPYEHGLPGIYYITPPDPKWTKAEQDEYVMPAPLLLFTSVHEVWPGHFVQFLHAKHARSKIGKVMGSYAFGEGWAHYVEEMMWEAGLGEGDPEVHIGQLIDALLRDVRLLSAIGLHTGKMTVAQSERMFRDVAFQDAGNARQQAARGTFDPGYGSYTLGKLMIRKLRADWTATRGGRDAWRAFHDELLDYGAPPLPLLRKRMLGPEAGPPF